MPLGGSGVSLLLWLRGRLSDRGKAVARNGLVVAVLLLVIALACFSVAGYGHTPLLRFPRRLFRP